MCLCTGPRMFVSERDVHRQHEREGVVVTRWLPGPPGEEDTLGVLEFMAREAWCSPDSGWKADGVPPLGPTREPSGWVKASVEKEAKAQRAVSRSGTPASGLYKS